MPSLKKTALIFLEIFFIECFSRAPMMLSLSSICIMQKDKYLENEKKYPKEEKAIHFYSEKPFKLAESIFYFMRTLRRV